MKSKVYFTKEITPEKVIELFKCLEKDLPGKVACKLHSGEPGNQNFLGPDFWKPIIEYLDGTVVECNTAYPGERTNAKDHLRVFEKHGWSREFTVDLLDAEGPDLEIPIQSAPPLQQPDPQPTTTETPATIPTSDDTPSHPA